MEKLPQQSYVSGGKTRTTFLFFSIESVQHVMLCLRIGSHNYRVFLFRSGYRSAGGNTVSAEFVTQHCHGSRV